MAFSLAVFQDADAARLFCGQAISQVCDKMATVGLVWVIAGLGSLRLVPWFLAAGALPHLLLARSSAGWIERWGALRAVVATDLARGVVFLAAWATWRLFPGPAYLIGLTVLANAASALFNPAILSLPMRLPPAGEGHLERLTAMIDSCFSLGNIVGPALAAFLYPWIGLGGLFAVNGLSYLLAAALESEVRLAPPRGAPRAPAGEGADRRVPLDKDALLRFVLGSFFLMNLALTPMLAFLPLFAKYRFHGRIGVLAGLETALGLGGAAGSLALSLWAARAKTGARLIGSTISVACLYLAFALSRRPGPACAALFALGLALSTVNVTMLSFCQSRPVESDVPRVMSFVNLISVGAIPLSMALVGGVIERVDLGALAIALACVLLLVSAGTALHPELRAA